MKFEKEIDKLNKSNEALDNAELNEMQHQKGKLTARERINFLLDPETFVELDPFVETRFSALGLDKKKTAGDAVITGFGKINNRIVYLFSQDFTKMGGSLGEMHGRKIVKTIEMAKKTGNPVIGIIDSGGARIQEGIASLDGYAPGLSDYIFMVDGLSQMYITGPEVIKKVTGEEVTFEDLGGANVHSSKSGCSHFRFPNEKDCFAGVKKLLSYLPQNNMEDPPRLKSILAELFEKEDNQKLLEIVPEESEKSYDMEEIIGEVFDKNTFFEVSADFAHNAITGLARLGGLVVGVVANQTKFMAGVLDIDSSDKIARFVRFCDAFNIPVINLVDTPGYLPGTAQEHHGIIRHGAKVLYAYAEASVPKISLILRKAFGGAYIALASRELGYDKVLAWPSAQIAVMGPEQAVKIIYKKVIAEAKDQKKAEQEKIEEMKQQFLDPMQAAKLGQIDLIINPKDTRLVLMKCLEPLLTKREGKIARKHGNTPL